MSIARRARHESKVWKTLIGFFFRGYPNRAYETVGRGPVPRRAKILLPP